MAQRTFRAVIFDLDGTLIDTESVAILAGRQAFADCGIGPDAAEAMLHRLVGTDQPTGARLLTEAFPALDLIRIQTLWQGGFEDRIARHLPLKPGAEDLLDRLAHPKAICTSSGQEAAHRKLALAGLARHFACVTTLACVSRPKPDPEPYALTAARLGLAPGDCVVFEDSEPGAQAARAAGCFVVQVPDVQPVSGDHADLVAPDLLTGAREAGLI